LVRDSWLQNVVGADNKLVQTINLPRQLRRYPDSQGEKYENCNFHLRSRSWILDFGVKYKCAGAHDLRPTSDADADP